MFARIPVVGSNAGGTPEIIVDQETGLLYTPHDANQLARRIIWCADHPEEVARMVELGYLRAKGHFTIEATVHKIYSVIAEVLEEERAR